MSSKDLKEALAEAGNDFEWYQDPNRAISDLLDLMAVAQKALRTLEKHHED